jgi:xanthine/uracil permease
VSTRCRPDGRHRGGGLFHATLGLFIGKIRFALPPLVTGLVVTMIGWHW